MKNRLSTPILTIIILLSSTLSFGQSESVELQKNIIDLNDEQYANTTFEDILTKYEGKVIYLDFWASWCGPCKKEMPYSHKLQETFLGKDVVFVYMSSDKNASPWVSAVDRLNLTGEHYRSSYSVKQEYATRFNVRYIPRYVLINKKGKVVDDTAKRPSDPEVMNDIKALL